MKSQEFFNTVGSYRMKQVYFFLIESEFADVLLELNKKANPEKICLNFGWDKSFGGRFINMLIHTGFLLKTDKWLVPSEFLTRYFSKSSKLYQGYNIQFEEFLVQSWQTLDKVLLSGQRHFGTMQKSDEQYLNDLQLYIRAMDNVAAIRAEELFEELSIPTTGIFIDVAAGSGAYIHEFLERYPNWNAVYYDLAHVKDISKMILKERVLLGHYKNSVENKIQYRPINFLENKLSDDILADCLLLSNIVHCYNTIDVEKLIVKCKSILHKSGKLIIHDFFKDSETGSVYDIHMMLNTHDGKTFYQKELIDIMHKAGFVLQLQGQLPSESTYLCFEQYN